MHVNKIGSVEQLKTIVKKEFGRLIGLKNLPNLPKLRSLLHEIVFANISKPVIGDYFNIYSRFLEYPLKTNCCPERVFAR